MADIFLSYARTEREKATRIKDMLEELGLTVFFDVEGLDGGDVFPDVLDREVKTAGAVVSCWSPHSLTRPWVKAECRIGQTRGVLVPVAIEALGDLDVPLEFIGTQYIDLSAPSDGSDAQSMHLVRALARALERPDLLDQEIRAHQQEVSSLSSDERAEMEKMRAELASFNNVEQPAAKVSASEQLVETEVNRFDPERYVFISYPKDVAPALMRDIVQRLLKKRISVWLYEPNHFGFSEEELAGMNWARMGDDYSAPTFRAMENAKCVLLLVGKYTLRGGFQMAEVEKLASREDLVSAIVDDLSYKDLPQAIAKRHSPQLTGLPSEAFNTLDESRSARLNMMIREIEDKISIEGDRRNTKKVTSGQQQQKIPVAGLLFFISLFCLVAAVLVWADPFGWFGRGDSTTVIPVGDSQTGTHSSTQEDAGSAGHVPPGEDRAGGDVGPGLPSESGMTGEGRAVGSTFTDCSGCPEMVVLPSGSVLMGSNDGESDEKPVHEVTIGYKFAVSKFEITWDQWEACVSAGGCDGAGPQGTGGDEGWGKGSRPVMNVSWDDAQAYARWLSDKTGQTYRLLSEAEWEYAARGVTTVTAASTKYGWGDEDPTCSRGARNGANFRSCSSDRTEPVGYSAANAFGLHDMHGNVYEWTQDCWNGSYTGAPSTGGAWEAGDCSRRVVRGGSWFNIPNRLRSASRVWVTTTNRNGIVGFRLARTL